MLDHVCISVSPSKLDAVVEWYVAALSPLGYTLQRSYPTAFGLGPTSADTPFWIFAAKDENATAAGNGLHLAFKAKDHETVDKFHEEAIKAGGKDNGKPGLRALYGPDYYAAFVLDPQG